MLVAGIDGGQSSTVAIVADDDATVIGRGVGGPADEIGAGPNSTRLRDALASALAAAMRDAGLPDSTQLAAITAGISGYEGSSVGVAPVLPSAHVTLLHDAPIAHAGALAGAAGVVVIAGTGSVAYGRSRDGRTALRGGWGYLFGDEGSAFWIARTAIASVATHLECPAAELMLSFFEVRSMRELVRNFYLGGIGRDDLAAFAPHCIEAARENALCACVRAPVLHAAQALAALARSAVVETAEPFAVAFTGGLMRDSWFHDQAYARTAMLFAAEPALEATMAEPEHEPAFGAVLLALRAAGIEDRGDA